MNEQMSIFDFLDIRNPQKPPKFDWNSVDWNKYPGLDIYYEAFPETPPKIVKIVDSRAIRIENELHELNKTLKDILREMRKRK